MTPEPAGMLRPLCLVALPFGPAPGGCVPIDFDQVYSEGIAPAVRENGIECRRADSERTAGTLDAALFARLLLAEFVVADLTTGDPGVFYQLGVRHAARPGATLLITAGPGDLPFDLTRAAIPYELQGGRLTPEAAAALRSALERRIRQVREGPPIPDSPLFHLFRHFPGIEMSPALTQALGARMAYTQALHDRFEAARGRSGGDAARTGIEAIEAELGDPDSVEPGILMDLLLSYRDIRAWDAMAALYQRFPAHLQETERVRRQFALALHRRAGEGDRENAVELLETLIERGAAGAETYTLLGRIYKALYKRAAAMQEPLAAVYLERAIDAYTHGFEREPADYYPGICAISLLLRKGTERAQTRVERLLPLVSFAVARQGGASSGNYWDLAAVLNLAVLGRDDKLAISVLPRALAAARAGWMARTTAHHLERVLGLRRNKEDTRCLQAIIEELHARAKALGE